MSSLGVTAPAAVVDGLFGQFDDTDGSGIIDFRELRQTACQQRLARGARISRINV